MRPNIGIAGFGMEGQATYALFRDSAHITVFDEAIPQGLPEEVSFVQSLSIPAEIELVYKSPGIATSKLVLASPATRITTLMEYVLERVRDRAIGVTGTKGKSTVASLITHILKRAGRDAVLMGNIGILDLGLILNDTSERLYVLELSSYQCEHITRSPHVAVLTNLYPEHLTHHGSFDLYKEAKLNLARFQKSDDIFINGSDLRVEFEGKVLTPETSLFETKLLGVHNQRNCELALTATKAVGVSEEVARSAIATFTPLAYRLEGVGTYSNVTFYDDSLATIPEATLASLAALPHVDTLILGGEDRGIAFDAFADVLAASDVSTFIAFPDTGAKMVAKVNAERVVSVRTMEEAVQVAYERTPPGGVVLLSNASPSFNLFKDYKDKSAQYRKWIEVLGKSMTMRKPYFIGIGGIGMSALAQLMQDAGAQVAGSDREDSPTTELLRKKGVTVHIGQKAENVPADADLVVYSEAVWEDNVERMRAKELNTPQRSYFEMLGEVSKGKKTIAVAGTHGKTTTTGMLAKVLADAGAAPTAVVGSIVQDFGSNYLKGESDLFVVEACEYKRDFLTLTPHILVVTNIEWDHTDYYKDLADLQSAFRTLMEKVPVEGAIVTDAKHPNIAPLLIGLSANIVDYTGENAYELRLPGEFNQNNARAAAAAARLTYPAATNDSIATSLSHFHGTWRRFEYKGKTKKGAEVYDDYAHHPTAVKATLAELKKKTKGKIYIAFHPHLYSRTRDLLPEFATAFADADRVIIAPIYPAREIDDGTISSAMLAAEITKNGTEAKAGTFEEIRRYFETEPGEGDTIMTMGAGDIYKVADELVG